MAFLFIFLLSFLFGSHGTSLRMTLTLQGRIKSITLLPVHHVGVGHGHIGEGRQLHEYVKDGAWVEAVGVSKVYSKYDQGQP